jgi:RecJ-like exonuclease
MNDKNIEWDKLEKKRTVEIVTTTYNEKTLEDGVYVCPRCCGDGQVTEVYRDPGPNKMGKCYTCHGIGEIRKCDACNVNSVPNYKEEKHRICLECHDREFQEAIKKFQNRCRISD